MSDAVRAGNIRELVVEYLQAMERLRPYEISSLADFAEYLFEQALGGKRVGRGQKGHDVVVPNLGRLQVKQRCLPPDGRIEERLHLRSCTRDGCDYLGAIIFNVDYSIRKASLIPFAEVWRLIEQYPDREKNVRFDLLAQLPGAVDLSVRIRNVLSR
jgi:hypothetical protein